MKTSTALAALFLAGALTPVAATSAESKHAAHKSAHHAASGAARGASACEICTAPITTSRTGGTCTLRK